jgi:hypothetical protein
MGQREEREEAPRMEGADHGEKHIFEKTPMARGPNGPVERSGGLRGRNGLAQWTAPARLDLRENSNGNWILNFNMKDRRRRPEGGEWEPIKFLVGTWHISWN